MEQTRPALPLSRYLAPFLTGTVLLGVYLARMAPGLSWAHGGVDGGDLIAAAATGGVAHPTGYPLFVGLGKLFSLLPIGSMAWRVNLASAIFAAIAVWLIYRTIVLLTSDRLSSAIAAGLAKGRGWAPSCGIHLSLVNTSGPWIPLYCSS